jgi:hypothetical protein
MGVPRIGRNRPLALLGIVALIACSATFSLSARASVGRRNRLDNPAPDAVSVLEPNAFAIYNDFTTPEGQFASRSVVVHYVTSGVNAPPLNDDDGDGVPDYVQRVGEAADTAIAYYRRRGFRLIVPDEGGPDGRPDIYVSRFAAGVFGVSFPGPRADGGAFVVVSNMLDPSPERSIGSLYGTVAHELFHLTQFSYFADNDPVMPSWVLEGSAAAMENRVYPELDDIAAEIQLRKWFEATDRPVSEQSYGAQLLWGYLDRLCTSILPFYLSNLGTPGTSRTC